MSIEQIDKMTPLDLLANDIYQHCPDLTDNYCGDTHCVACLANALYNAGYRKQSENTVALPCKIGDTVYTYRNYGGKKQILSGTVSEIFYIGKEMRLCIVVHRRTRGTWGENVFGTYEEAERRLMECQTKK